MGKNLKAEIDPKSGFCFGVVNAIKKAEEILAEGKPLYCLGQIVHNDEEVGRLEQKGLITISREELFKLRNQTVLIRAHGEPPSTYKTLESGGNKIIDATCPIVIKLQKRVKTSFEEGRKVLIFGKNDHPEVVGLRGQIAPEDQVVFEKYEDLDLSHLPKQLTLYSQTTMSIKELYRVRDNLAAEGFEVDFKDTVCRQVSGRVEELKEFSRRHDKVIFVTGKNSSNGKVLFAHCKEVNPNSYKITSLKEIQEDWFSPNDTVGVCGATSTPSWLMEEVKTLVENL